MIHFCEADISRFVAFVSPEPNSGCWLWCGSIVHGGYGKFKISNVNFIASRVAFTMFVQQIPQGMVVCHKCDTPTCVNPEHLFIGTQRENVADREAKGRGAYGDRHRSKLSSSQVIEIRRLFKRGARNIDIAQQFNISQALASFIKNRRLWRCIPDEFLGVQ